MHTNGMFSALICINNHILSCYDFMLSIVPMWINLSSVVDRETTLAQATGGEQVIVKQLISLFATKHGLNDFHYASNFGLVYIMVSNV